MVAIFQAFKLNAGDKFTAEDSKVMYRLGQMSCNMLRNSGKLDQAHKLYNATVSAHRRCAVVCAIYVSHFVLFVYSEAVLLDIAKALASETKLESIVQV